MLRPFVLFGLLAVVGTAEPIRFRLQEIAQDLGVVYAVTTADVNGDGKRDIVLINNTQLLWFENPGWTKHVVTEKVTAKDNVALSVHDIDRDGKADFALGADWQPANTTGGGSLHWVSNGGQVHNIATEPTIHRIRWADVMGGKEPELIVVPLHGKGTKAPEWTDGPGSRILVYSVPQNPATDAWPVEVASDALHITHNFTVVGKAIWVAATEGVYALERGRNGQWSQRLIGAGKPGEIKLGKAGGKRQLATVEPWHGNSLVVYTESGVPWQRAVVDGEINQGHALGWADFDRDGNDELVAGWRGKPWGLALYQYGKQGWTKSVIDTGVAVEDLTIEDLNGDGRPEIIAGGRATGNLRIYWREE